MLLHGFPEFWYAWRHQIPVLADHYTVIAPDMHGAWADIATDLPTVGIPDCRHLPHEERPGEVNAHLPAFLSGG